jgi:hypothetical protein
MTTSPQPSVYLGSLTAKVLSFPQHRLCRSLWHIRHTDCLVLRTGFTEGFDTRDLKDAKALLEELAG